MTKTRLRLTSATDGYICSDINGFVTRLAKKHFAKCYDPCFSLGIEINMRVAIGVSSCVPIKIYWSNKGAAICPITRAYAE